MAYLHYFSYVLCPSCQTRSNFHMLHVGAHTERRERKSGAGTWVESDRDFTGLFSCGTCKGARCIVFRRREDAIGAEFGWRTPIGPQSVLNFLRQTDWIRPSKGGKGYLRVNVDNPSIDLRQGFDIVEVGGATEMDSPRDLPEDLTAMYEVDLANVLNSPKHTVIECRSIIELACKLKLGETKGTVAKKIDDLVDAGFIPKIVGEWAHEIRDFGNRAVHDGERPTAEEGKEIATFTKLLLELLYSYPARIERLRSQRQKNDATSQDSLHEGNAD